MAEGNHITISNSPTRVNGLLREGVDQLQKACDQIIRLKAIVDQAAVSSGWANLATCLGIESSADAETIYNLLTAVDTTLADSDITTFLAVLG